MFELTDSMRFNVDLNSEFCNIMLIIHKPKHQILDIILLYLSQFT